VGRASSEAPRGPRRTRAAPGLPFSRPKLPHGLAPAALSPSTDAKTHPARARATARALSERMPNTTSSATPAISPTGSDVMRASGTRENTTPMATLMTVIAASAATEPVKATSLWEVGWGGRLCVRACVRVCVCVCVCVRCVRV
jgi:hypothetical protein